MKLKEMRKIENYFEVFIILFLLFLFFLLIKSYILPLLLAATFVFLTREYYKKLVKKTKNETWSAIFLLTLVLTIILLPTYFVSVALINETSNLISFGNQALTPESLEKCTYDFCRTIENNLEVLDSGLESIFMRIASYLSNSIDVIFSSVTKFAIGFAIFILGFFFLQKDGDKLVSYIRRLIPMKDQYKDALFLRFKDVSSAVFTNSILVAIIQGALVGIGFAIVGISSPVFWSLVASFFALLPMIGAGIVWVPVVIYLLIVESYFKAIFLLLYGGIIVSFSDNFLRAYLLNKKVSVHPFLIFLSIMGGLEVFGFLGIFLGPIIISLLISVLQLYKLDFH